MGVFKALEESGIKDGDSVRIATYEFVYYSDELREIHEDER